MSNTPSKWYAVTLLKALPGTTYNKHPYAQVGRTLYCFKRTDAGFEGTVYVHSGDSRNLGETLTVEQAKTHLKLGHKLSEAEATKVEEAVVASRWN